MPFVCTYSPKNAKLSCNTAVTNDFKLKEGQCRRFLPALNRFTALVSLTAIDNDGLVTVPESGHNTKLQRMFRESWLMFRSFTELHGFASKRNEFPVSWCSLFGHK